MLRASRPTGVRPEVFYYCGLLAWLLFANSMTSAGNSLLGSQHLVTKVYFPRLITPDRVRGHRPARFRDRLRRPAGDAGRLWRDAGAPDRVCCRCSSRWRPGGVGFRALAERAVSAVQGRASRRALHHPALAVLHAVLYPSSAVHGGWKRVAPGSQPDVGDRRWLPLVRPRATAPGLPALASSAATIVVVLALVAILLPAGRADALADRI